VGVYCFLSLSRRMQLAESVAQLVTAVIRNHSTAAISCAGPMMFTLNSISINLKQYIAICYILIPLFSSGGAGS